MVGVEYCVWIGGRGCGKHAGGGDSGGFRTFFVHLDGGIGTACFIQLPRKDVALGEVVELM